MWNLDELYPSNLRKRDPSSKVKVNLNGKTYSGHLTRTHPANRAQRVYRFWFDEDLLTQIKEIYLMSYMRDIEGRLSDASMTIEDDIAFWEFLDIEFDEATRTFHLTAHYKQKPTFPELFKRLTYSPILKRVDDELAGKTEFRIHKQDWRPRSDYEAELGAENVIYTLIDTANMLIYIGEAQKLVRRFKQGHPSISNWDYYRYDQFPPIAKQIRVELERMMIRAFAATLPNRRGILSKEISEYRLANEKIDG